MRSGVKARGYSRAPWRAVMLVAALACVLWAAVGGSAYAAPVQHITGTVTDADTGLPLEGIEVVAEVSTGEDSWESVTGLTDSAGAYDLTGFSPGECVVCFYGGTEYSDQYYDAADSFASAQRIVVAEGATVSGIDAEMARASHITGTVTSRASGDPIEGVGVSVYQEYDGYWDWIAPRVPTEADGTYDIGGLEPGTYRVGFRPDTDYVAEYYDGVETVEQADDIVVGADETVANIDAALESASHITGRVTDAVTSGPVEDIQVVCYEENQWGQWIDVWATFTDASGNYDIGGLSAGTYRVGADRSNGHLGEYYDGADSVQNADDVDLGAADVASGIDFDLTPASHITGNVSDAVTGDPVEGTNVTALTHEYGAWEWIGSESSDVSGDYDIGGLPSGTYRVFFESTSGEYLSQYYGGASLSEADDVVLGVSETAANIDAELAYASHITGVVTDSATGNPVADVYVYACTPDGSGGWVDVGYGSTDATGTYDIGGLEAGTYRIKFDDSDYGRYAPLYYNGAESIDDAQDVVVGDAATISGINAVLGAGAHISGRVTGADTHAALDEAYASAYAPDGSGQWEWAGSSSTDASGTYSIGGLAAVPHRVRFYDYSGVHATQWYGGAPIAALASDVAVSKATTTTGIDAELVVGAHVTGTVTDADTALPVDYAWVDAYVADGEGGWAYYRGTDTYSNGSYEIDGLLPGSYRIEFSADGYSTRYYDGATSIDDATDVVVASGETSTGVDAQLSSLASQGDVEAPATSLSGVPSAWVSHEVTFTLTAEDYGSPLSGVAHTYYGLNAPAATPYAGPVTVNDEGVTTIKYRSVDTSGNVETTNTATVRIDKTAPVTADDHAAVYTASATIHLSPADPLSGAASTAWRLDGAAGSGLTVSTSDLGPHTLEYRSTDRAGNREETHTVTFAVIAATSAPPTLATNLTLSGKSSVKKKKTYTATAAISPKAAAGKVKFTFQRKVGKKWRTVTTAKVALSGGVAACKIKPKYKGSWRFTVTYAGSSTSSAVYKACTATRTFKVK